MLRLRRGAVIAAHPLGVRVEGEDRPAWAAGDGLAAAALVQEAV